MKIFAMFPGQGAQYVGMGQNIIREFPAVKKIFDEASTAIGFNLSELCITGPAEKLQLTENTQPAILTVSIAMFEIFKNECDITGFAGHSLGEYSALVASGRLKFVDAVKLVSARGKFMQDAVPIGIGAMSAVLNPDVVKIKNICNEFTTETESVEIVNYNTPQQFVIAGHKTAVEKAEAKLRAERMKCIKLPVSAPFHSRLMNSAREQMTPLIEACSFQAVDSVFISNVNAEVSNVYEKGNLIKQIDSPVLWSQSIINATQAGFEKFIEVGPGKVLQGLFKKIISDDRFHCESRDSQLT